MATPEDAKFQPEIVVELQTPSQIAKLFTVIYESPLNHASYISFKADGCTFRSEKLISKLTFSSIALNGRLQQRVMSLQNPNDIQIDFRASHNSSTDERDYIGWICVPHSLDTRSIQTFSLKESVTFEATRLPNARLQIKWSLGDMFMNGGLFVQCPGMREQSKIGNSVQFVSENVATRLGDYDNFGDSFPIENPAKTGSVIIPLDKNHSSVIGIFHLKKCAYFAITIPFKK